MVQNPIRGLIACVKAVFKPAFLEPDRSPVEYWLQYQYGSGWRASVVGPYTSPKDALRVAREYNAHGLTLYRVVDSTGREITGPSLSVSPILPALPTDCGCRYRLQYRRPDGVWAWSASKSFGVLSEACEEARVGAVSVGVPYRVVLASPNELVVDDAKVCSGIFVSTKR